MIAMGRAPMSSVSFRPVSGLYSSGSGVGEGEGEGAGVFDGDGSSRGDGDGSGDSSGDGEAFEQAENSIIRQRHSAGSLFITQPHNRATGAERH